MSEPDAEAVSRGLFDAVKAALPLYPDGMCEVPKQIDGTAFFPGGLGLWREDGSPWPRPFPVHGIMVLGQDFDNLKGYLKSCARGGESMASPTWSALTSLLRQLETNRIPLERCFFTNAILGLRVAGANTGMSPAWNDPGFITRCGTLFALQMAQQRPRLLIVLGLAAARFVSGISGELSYWKSFRRFADFDIAEASLVKRVRFREVSGQECTVVLLVHPSFRKRNCRSRGWDGEVGHAAELKLLQQAADASGI